MIAVRSMVYKDGFINVHKHLDNYDYVYYTVYAYMEIYSIFYVYKINVHNVNIIYSEINYIHQDCIDQF